MESSWDHLCPNHFFLSEHSEGQGRSHTEMHNNARVQERNCQKGQKEKKTGKLRNNKHAPFGSLQNNSRVCWDDLKSCPAVRWFCGLRLGCFGFGVLEALVLLAVRGLEFARSRHRMWDDKGVLVPAVCEGHWFALA